MFLRFRTSTLALMALALAACDRQAVPVQPPAGSALTNAPASALIPGGGALPAAINPRALAYYDNAEAVENGKRLYNQYNCVGCHFNGGGGIGPPLMDDKWVYGGRLDQIYNTLVQGRPNGMPAWRGKIPEQQLWQIAAYVRSMSLPATLAANGSGTPSQHPAPVPRKADEHGGWTLPPDTVGEP